MQNFETFFKTILKDLQIELTDEFDKNFERKAFFDEAWQDTKWANSKGSLMMRTGAGRKSIKSTIEGEAIVWRSSLPYMGIHNDGGEVTVTQQMKRFFWAMYYKASNAIVYKTKTKKAANTQRNNKLTTEAAIWKSLALMKVGSKIKIHKRQFIGNHPQVDASVKRVVDASVKKLEQDFKQLFNPNK